MNHVLRLSIAVVAALLVGVSIGRYWKSGPVDEVAVKASDEPEILYWVAPMDPSYRRAEPGQSPMGMDLVPVYADASGGDPGTVTISPAVVNNLGVRTALAESGPLPRRIETVGYVGYDEDTLQHIHTRVEGWIERLSTKASGDPVKSGQLLFELYSPTLVNAQQEYLTARSSGNALLLDASNDRLLALGMTEGEIDDLDRERTVRQRVRVFAENDGVVAHLGVREGIFVTPATEVMSVAELDSVWIQAEVFERQAAWVQTGQRAEVELDYLPGRRWQGAVDYVYPEIDPATRALRVRLRFDNADGMLRPNMFARVRLFGSATEPVVHVPREALIRGSNLNRVVLALGGGRFRAQPVDVGAESGDRVAIRSGVSAGDRVVTSGQFLIDSESNARSALARMEDREVAADRVTRAEAPEEPDIDHEGHDSSEAMEPDRRRADDPQ